MGSIRFSPVSGCRNPVSPKAVVQLVHGVSEYIDRYTPVARFLNEHGFPRGRKPIIWAMDAQLRVRRNTAFSGSGTAGTPWSEMYAVCAC